MNILILPIAVVCTALYVLYDQKVVEKKNFAKKYSNVLAKTVAPIVILFFAVYATASWVAGFKIRSTLVAHPEILLEAGEALQEQQAQKERDASKDALKNIKDEDWQHAPILGNPNGRIVIYEFFDYNCGFCKRAGEVIEEVLKTEKDVKVVLKNFQIFPVSQIPARASVASVQQGAKAAEFHRLLITSNLTPQQASGKDVQEQINAIVFGLAQKAGLDVAKLKKDMESPAVEEELLRTRKLAEKLGIQGTPGFIVGNQVFRGYIETDKMLIAIDQAKTGN
jgi:protein-disulfide isomerase